jgi:D-glycero-D-manno-heptose 1,7-bisphosphate phosphatase
MAPSRTDNWETKPALCLDFDGTIRYSKTDKFINKPEDVALFEGVEEKIWAYRDQGYMIFGITNQGGVAFGYKTEEENEKEIERTLELFEKNPFHLVQSSYGHPKGTVSPFNHHSLLRKPYYGMLVLCEVEAKQMGVIVDWEESIFVGDSPEDQACAEAAGLTFIDADTFFERINQ